MTEPDEIMVRIGNGIELSHSGGRDRAEIGPDGDPLYRFAVAHSMADVQEDLHEELAWDLRALEAADLITDELSRQGAGAVPVRAFYPSRHLNLGAVYRELDDLPAARRRHLELGRNAAGALSDDGYSTMIKRGSKL